MPSLSRLTRDPARAAAFGVVLAMGFANGVGAVLSFVYNALLAPLPPGVGPRADVVTRNLPWFVVDLVGTGLLLTVLQARAVRTADAAPGDERARRVLRLPLLICVQSGAGWVVAVGGFVALNWNLGTHHTYACRTGLTIGFAGAVATTLNYLLAERALRPLFRSVLATTPPRARCGGGLRTRLIVTWVLGSALPLLWLAVALLDKPHAATATGSMLYLVAAGLVGGACVHAAVTNSVSDPVAHTSAALRRVGAGDLDVRVEVEDRGELGELQAAVNAMTAGLRERNRIEDLFGRFVSPEVAAVAVASGSGPRADRCEATVLFADVIGSTGLAETRSPEQMLALLNDFFDAIVDTVTAEGGWVNGFDGDGAICVFGPPLGTTDHAERGLRAARLLTERFAALRDVHPCLDAGVGVSTGSVIAGHVGAARRYEYTVVGTPVNEAARLTDAAKRNRARALASETTVRAAGAEAARWRTAGTAPVRGADRTVAVWAPRRNAGHGTMARAGSSTGRAAAF